jgi:hypothetical protein
MSTGPRAFLTQATAQLPAGTEDGFRCAINRAYYGAFHGANIFHDALPARGQLPAAPKGVHATLYHALANPQIPMANSGYMKSKQLGYIGVALKRTRTRADYELADTLVKLDAETAIAEADKMLAIAGL